MNIYISGALKGSSDLDVARAKYEHVAECLAGLGVSPYVPHTTTDPVINRAMSAPDVYLADIRQIESANAAVIFLDEPSFGVGLEIGLFVSRGVPILALCEHQVDPSRFAVGFLNSAGVCVTIYHFDPIPAVVTWAERELLPIAA